MADSDSVPDRTRRSDKPDQPSFAAQATDLLHGQRVRVESQAGQRFEGDLERVWIEKRHVLLRNVQELPGGVQYATTFVAHVDWIVSASPESE